MGSARELETQLLLAVRLGYSTLEEVKPALRLVDETCKLIWGLLKSELPATNHGTTDSSRLSSVVQTGAA